MITFLESKLKPFLDPETNAFTPAVQEEYLTPNGWVEKSYICKKADVHMSTASYRKALKTVFGQADFNMLPVENEVSEEEFLEVHEFGKHTARHYISIFAEQNKVLTREKLFEYMLNYTELSVGLPVPDPYSLHRH